jgi:hypothetical protein
MAAWFWNRPLLAPEKDFVRTHFGASLDALLPRMRLHVRRLGDTRRALSLNGGRIFLPRAFFLGGDPHQALRLDHARIAGIFAHELLHQWQRLQGMPVTRQAAWLHLRALCTRVDPYAYERSDDAHAMLHCFASAHVERQGQIWEDHVHDCVAGHAGAAGALIADLVRSGVRSGRPRR